MDCDPSPRVRNPLPADRNTRAKLCDTLVAYRNPSPPYRDPLARDREHALKLAATLTRGAESFSFIGRTPSSNLALWIWTDSQK
jgi:hypothetical protein